MPVADHSAGLPPTAPPLTDAAAPVATGPVATSPVATSPVATDHLTVLGHERRSPVEHVECFAAPPGVTEVRFRTDELASMCPVTAQPDLSSVLIEYEPNGLCVESKSLKLYLWSFRDRRVFAEALAAEIAGEVMATARPHRVRVTLTQRPRGGITVEAVAELGGNDDPRRR